MKYWVYVKSRGQLKLDSTGVNDARNDIWTDVLGGEFMTLRSERQVMGREPNALSHLVVGGWGTVTISYQPIPLRRTTQRLPGVSPDPADALKMLLDGGDRHLHLLYGKKWRLEAHGNREG